MNTHDLTRVTLDHIDKTRRQYYAAFVAAAMVEGLGLAAFLLLADLKDRTHILILLAAILTYGTLAFGLLALGVYTRWWALRIVQAVDTAAPSDR